MPILMLNAILRSCNITKVTVLYRIHPRVQVNKEKTRRKGRGTDRRRTLRLKVVEGGILMQKSSRIYARADVYSGKTCFQQQSSRRDETRTQRRRRPSYLFLHRRRCFVPRRRYSTVIYNSEGISLRYNTYTKDQLLVILKSWIGEVFVKEVILNLKVE